MNKSKLHHISELWDSELLDPENWLPVHTSELPPSKKSKFLARKKALLLYLTTDTTLDRITGSTSISKTELYRIVERAFSPRADGQPVGYLACIPGYRIKPYERTTKKASNGAGSMTQFLKDNPEIHKQLDDWALGKKKLNHTSLRGRNTKRLWLAFRKACELADLDTVESYPFSNADGGREAIRQYVKRLRDREFVANARVLHGTESGRLAASNSIHLPTPTTIPYDVVQLDGHCLDGIFNIRMLDPQGNEIDLPLSRIWLLVLIDTGSRAVLGYQLSLSANYTAEDVLACLGSSLEPWKPKELIESRNDLYKIGAGLPSGVINECAWRIFNTLQMDNAFSHRSASVQSRVIETGAIEVITIRPRSPRSNSIVERFMQTFEEVSLHNWPNTTGSQPNDPKRRNPEAAAARLNIGIEELEIITDLTMANYNATPHSSLNGRTPLEYLEYRLEKGADLVRYASSKTLDGLALFEREYGVTVRANLEQGHKPYIKFKNVRYSSVWLQNRFDLNKTKVVFRVNTRDIRSGFLFLPSGECLGSIDAEPRWLERAHSISSRRAIAKLVKSNKLNSESSQPVTDFLDYLAKQAPLTRKARNLLLKNERISPAQTNRKNMSKTKNRFETLGNNSIRLNKTYSE